MPSQLPADTNLSSPQIKLIDDWNEAFMERNMENFAKHMHKDFRRLVYPQSLDQPEQGKEEALKELSGMLDLLIGFDLQTTFHSFIEAPGRVVVHCTYGMKEPTGEETTQEVIYIAHIVTDEDGSLKIKQVEDFLDTNAYLEFAQSMGPAIAATHSNK